MLFKTTKILTTQRITAFTRNKTQLNSTLQLLVILKIVKLYKREISVYFNVIKMLE